VQVKSAKHGSYPSTKRSLRETLGLEQDVQRNAKPVFALKKKGRWTFKHLSSEASIQKLANEVSNEEDDDQQNADETDNSVAMRMLEELIEDRFSEV